MLSKQISGNAAGTGLYVGEINLNNLPGGVKNFNPALHFRPGILNKIFWKFENHCIL